MSSKVARSTKRIFGGQSGEATPEGGEGAEGGVLRTTDRGPGVVREGAAAEQPDQLLETLPVDEPPTLVADDAPTVALAPVDGRRDPLATTPGGSAPPAVVSEPQQAPLRCPQCATVFSEAIKFCPFDGQMLEAASDWDPARDPLLGKTVSGRYEVEGTLAEGSMGTVYRVRHTKLEARFALQVLRRELAEDSAVAARLVEEARATAAIGHPNIVSVSDFGEIDSSLLPELGSVKLPYFVTEYLDGGSLGDAIRVEGPLDAQRVVRIMAQVSGALAAAHHAGMVHRDLKPESIRLTHTEGGEIAKVVDFGVAQVMSHSKRTKQGFVYGTPHYMSPEQAQGAPVDGRTDIYAVGVIMHQCLTGELPFVADSYMGVVTKHIFAQAPAPPVAAFGGLALGPVLKRCLAKEPGKRYATMDDLRRRLEALLAGRDEPSLRTSVPAGLQLREPAPSMPDGRLELAAGLPTTRSWLWAVLVVVTALVLALSVVLVRRHAGNGARGAASSGPRAARSMASPPPSGPTARAVVPASSDTTAAPEEAASAGAAGGSAAQPSATAPVAHGSPPPPATPRHPPPHRPPATTPGEVVDPWAK